MDGTAFLRLQVVALHRVFQPAVLHRLIVDGVAAAGAAYRRQSLCVVSLPQQCSSTRAAPSVAVPVTGQAVMLSRPLGLPLIKASNFPAAAIQRRWLVVRRVSSSTARIARPHMGLIITTTTPVQRSLHCTLSGVVFSQTVTFKRFN